MCGVQGRRRGVGASAWPYGRLEVLRLGHNNLGAAGAAALAALVGGKGLRELHLPGTGIGDAGARRARRRSGKASA